MAMPVASTTSTKNGSYGAAKRSAGAAALVLPKEDLQPAADYVNSSQEAQFIPLPLPNYACTSTNYTPTVEVAKAVTEYPLPGARETHEMAVVDGKMLVVTQQTNSTLVKVLLDPDTGRPVSCASFLLGDFWAGLHGLALSKEYKNQLWATLQFQSKLIRIDPGSLSQAQSAPIRRQEISLPYPARGPHSIQEYGANLWTCCKDSSHVVRIKHRSGSVRDFSIYPCSARPIFVAQHPTSKDMYASLDISSKIWRLQDSTQKTEEIDIPAQRGRTPVGLVAGTDGNVWFTLLGSNSGGSGTFARILPSGDFQWFSLSSPVAPDVGLIHLAFDQDRRDLPNDVQRAWLLSSTLIADAGKSVDGVFSVLIDSSKEGRIITQASVVLPTQRCATHRVLAHGTGLFVSEMLASSVAHVTGAAARHPDLIAEKSDFYMHFGLGQMMGSYDFDEQ